MPIRVGIDLGTTYSAVSYVDADKVETLELEAANNGKLLPSVVYYERPDAEPVVGTAAANAFRNSPDLVVRGIKKEMGTDYTTPPMHGRRRTPAEVSAEILKVLLENASAYLGEPIAQAVVTVPAYFADAERNQTKEACALAGVPLQELLSEPLAAAIAYSCGSAGDIKTPYVLVYDLGGGTFDVTLLRAVKSGAGDAVEVDLETLAKVGARVGGLDWDRQLFELVCSKSASDIRADPRAAAEVLSKCEAAKQDLSRVASVSITTGSVAEAVQVTREEFESATKALLLQTELLLEEVLASAQKASPPISRQEISVLLAGGSTRMPAVTQMIERVMGAPPLKHKNPDLLVTIGAAYYAELTSNGKLTVRKPGASTPTTLSAKLTDISRQAVGVEILREGSSYNAHIVPLDAKFGTEYRRLFATSDDDMTSIDIVLYEGPEVREPEKSAECNRLMSCQITGLPSGRPRGAKVEVTLGWDASGILRGHAIDCQTGQETPIKLDRGLVSTQR